MEISPSLIEAVECPAEVLQIVACAGSGKTEALARRAVKYLSQGVAPDAIVAFTFTEKAAEELKNRIDSRAAEADPACLDSPPSSRGLFAGTMHSYCLRLIQRSGAYELFDVLTEEHEWALLNRFARRLGVVDIYREQWPSEKASKREAMETFLRNTAVVHNELLPRDVIAQTSLRFSEVFAKYEELLRALRVLTFDQIIDRAAITLVEGGPARKLVEGKVKRVLVDEYQDLNRAQERVLELLRKAGAEITVVGDDDQAIYQWRGGDVSVFLDFPKRFGGTRKELSENRRSVPGIVSLSHKFALTIDHRVHKQIVPARNGPAQSIEIMVGETSHDEAVTIADRICILRGSGHTLGDMAVLFRSVRTSARPLMDELRSRGIPFSLTGRVSILDRPEAALVARIFAWWGDGPWWPGREPETVTDGTIAGEIEQLVGCGEPAAKRKASELRRLGEYFTYEGFRDLQNTFRRILVTVGIPAEQDKARQERGLGAISELLVSYEHGMRRSAPGEWFQRREPGAAQESAEDSEIQHEIGPLKGTAAERTALEKMVSEPVGRIYLRWLVSYLEHFASQAIEETSEGPEPTNDAVNIMTIHQAKGLEFPIVFMPSLVRGRFPSSLTGSPQKWYLGPPAISSSQRQRYEGLERDERRLFYVAMTRARDLLVMSLFLQHKTQKAHPSPFVTDIARVSGGEITPGGVCTPATEAHASRSSPPALDCRSLLAYGDCPRFYYLRFVCGFGSQIALELGFGRALHHTVAQLARMSLEDRPVTEAVAHEILSQVFYLPFATRVQRDILYDSARKRISRFVSGCRDCLARVIEVEHAFEVPIAGSKVRGRVDLILRAQTGSRDEVELLDVKTSEDASILHKHQNQLRLYAKAMSHLGLKAKRLTIFDMEGPGQRLEVPNDAAALGAFENDLATWIRGIQDREFDSHRGPICSSCEFKGTVCR